MTSSTDSPPKKRLSPEVLGGIALIAAALGGILVMNSPLAELYARFIATPIEVSFGTASIAKPLQLWVNDGLMAVFFLLVALELKREVLEGELSQLSRVTLPLVAAVGGIAAPAVIYWLFNRGDPVALQGWAIPAATDIAFALGVLAMLGSRVPPALKAFLLSVAVFDDLGAILIIATLYTEDISWTAKGLAVLGTVALLVINRCRVTRIAPYILVGIFLWVCVLKSGVHATLAGVVVGLMIPHEQKTPEGKSPLIQFEHALHPWVAFAIVPLFAFVNSGVPLTGLQSVILDPVALGIGVGLLAGKLLGVFGSAALLIRLGWAQLPRGVTWSSFAGVCILAGIGFTMSLFIGQLAFENSERDLAAPLRVGVLGGSLVAALVGFAVLKKSLPRKGPGPSE